MPPDAQPKTIPALGSGQMLRRDVRPFVVANKGETLVVDMPGHDLEGEGVPIGDDMIVVDRAPRSLEETVGAVPRPPKIRRVRVKLKLSQRQGGLGAPGRRESFDTDERGLVEPSGPTLQFVRILDRHP
ncbi:type II toxin-antitoxin system MqsA family antitoxin, partial [Klebsiella pneumoniae]|uniref:type II toxin-antitoxin system MqsA family antitoxin n=1 Tax=Klebsiella pneumoniae TaxID=573 RepID=UPI000E67CDEF